jgi:hypothetical protein
MRTLIGTLTFVLLAGCSTVSDLTVGNPTQTYVSTKSPDVIANCVFPAWQRYDESSELSNTGRDWQIVSRSFWRVNDVVQFDLSDEKSGSIIKHYQRPSASQSGRDIIRIAMNHCL